MQSRDHKIGDKFQHTALLANEQPCNNLRESAESSDWSEIFSNKFILCRMFSYLIRGLHHNPDSSVGEEASMSWT